MEGYRVRRAVAADAAQIARLMDELGYPTTVAAIRGRLRAIYRRPDDIILTAGINGRVVGAAHLHTAEMLHEPGRIGRVMALVVAERDRRLGVGRRLLTELELAARRQGCVKVEVTSGLLRDAAHSFYEALGYVEQPRRFIKRL
jgi:GNAT superfamily N-acetyltransferase